MVSTNRVVIGRGGFLIRLGLIVLMAGALSIATGTTATGEPPACAPGPVVSGKTVLGTDCADRIVSPPPGVTTIRAGGGDDLIVGSPDVVEIHAGSGDDVVYGDEAPEGVARSRLRGRATVSNASCPEANPCYLGDGSEQSFFAGDGDDVVFGQRGNDYIYGENNEDKLYGGIGDDRLFGGTWNDLLSGGFGYDRVYGQEANDVVRGDASKDEILSGDADTDTLSYATAVVPGFSGSFPEAAGTQRGVHARLDAGSPDNGGARFGGGVDTINHNFEHLIGSPFSDYLVGNGGVNRIDGGGGGDAIFGLGGDDQLYGGADNDHLDGGADNNTLDGSGGQDYCLNGTSTGCDPGATFGADARSSAYVSVGLMVPSPAKYSNVYVSGSDLSGNAWDDVVVVDYADNGANPDTVTVNSYGVAPFDPDPSGCALVSATQAVCTLPKPLDSIVLAGLAGNDILDVNGFPHTTSVYALGGEGIDWVLGDGTEDVLVDGPDELGGWDDQLEGMGNHDALVNNNGADDLYGGDGSDLLVSASLCDGDLLDGDAGDDNASWARWSESGVEVRLARVGPNAGRVPNNQTGGPFCFGGEALDTVTEVSDLEGTSSGDHLWGTDGPNLILARSGFDTVQALAGTDTVRTNAADYEEIINCSAGGGERAVVDYRSLIGNEYNKALNGGCESPDEQAAEHTDAES